MKLMLRTALTGLLLLIASHTFASHIVGGEIYYDSLGNNQYKITFEVYRDCGPGNTSFDSTINYTIFYGDGSFWASFDAVMISKGILPIVYDDPCVTPPNDICIERAIFVDTVTLPLDQLGYYISYQRCCWANNIDNITNPGDNGITLTTFVPGTDLVSVHNQGARFINYPPLVLCAGNNLNFDHSAFDPDSDSLSYELITPFQGGSGINADPAETAPPYSDLIWEPGYSGINPFGPGSNVTINQQTGMMTFTPNLTGTYVAGVAVKEYRNGVLINTKIRTFGYRVVNCELVPPIEVEVIAPNNGGQGGPQLIEDCGFAGFIITRPDTTTTLNVQILLSGTAINGTDYTQIPDSIIIPVGVFSDTIGISALLDGITEGPETVTFSIVIPYVCGVGFDTTTITMNIVDYLAMQVNYLDSANICADFGETTQLWCNVTNGVPPYQYFWGPGAFPNNDTVTIFPNMVQPNVNAFNIIIADACNKSVDITPILVYNQCPLIVPNVVTANDDGTNDALIITNREDYDKVSLTILNRWGHVIYENGDYKNDWKGTDSKGNILNEGVYFYIVTPVSEKYEYDDQQKTLYTAHGFFHLYTK